MSSVLVHSPTPSCLSSSCNFLCSPVSFCYILCYTFQFSCLLLSPGSLSMQQPSLNTLALVFYTYSLSCTLLSLILIYNLLRSSVSFCCVLCYTLQFSCLLFSVVFFFFFRYCAPCCLVLFPYIHYLSLPCHTTPSLYLDELLSFTNNFLFLPLLCLPCFTLFHLFYLPFPHLTFHDLPYTWFTLPYLTLSYRALPCCILS